MCISGSRGYMLSRRHSQLTVTYPKADRTEQTGGVTQQGAKGPASQWPGREVALELFDFGGGGKKRGKHQRSIVVVAPEP
ncbi:hypothetical protein L249_6114 [Ophiocordyceps polyrhachis-furcata BCC 54312]|uniref:Uncharacterized protein n=1 Tax=Ophiocordyceps polyrhachis-furcata BCC 54312 TaxID=1330021 RepID=A0A367LIP2_9HYPO|nr:hypothetical protein L249_6114 [Ophiocordyceps polyrhachis-furcata BCC 54312]